MMRRSTRYLCFTLLCGVLACASHNDEAKPGSAPHVATPLVTDARTDLLFSWFDKGEPKTGATVKDIPDGARKEVRVQDPTVPPEKRDPAVIFLADLTKPQANGSYPVKIVKRAEYEAKRRAVSESARKTAAEAEAARMAATNPAPSVTSQVHLPAGAPQVVMYATRHCPVCIKARRWLLEQKIPYVERDLEQDPSAAAEVQQKGAAQGVPTNGVPIFEVGGRLLPGFEPAKIIALLSGTTSA